MSEVIAYFVSHLLTCLLTLTFAYKYATMLILGGTAFILSLLIGRHLGRDKTMKKYVAKVIM